MATSVLKIKHEGEIFRLTLQGEPSFDAVVAAIAVAWPEFAAPEPAAEGPAAALGPLQGRAKYVDDEGDLCTLTPHTFGDFLTLHGCKGGTNSGRVLKLELQPPPATVDAPSQPAPRPAAPEAQRPPPGLVQAPAAEGHKGAGHRGACMGPKRLILAIKALQQSGWLTNEMLACLAVQGLPIMTQRVARKVDKINHLARQGQWQNLRKLVEALALCALETPGLEQHAGPLQEALLEEPGPAHLGESLLALLRSVGALSFEAKVRLVEALRDQLLPLFEDVASELGIDSGEWDAVQGLPSPMHVGVTCDGCGMSPLVGPRFRCGICPDYDLCGNCYPKKQELHSPDGGSHEFKCILKGACMGKGKAKGKGKGKAAFWHLLNLKGAGKGGAWGPPWWSQHGRQAGTEAQPGVGVQAGAEVQAGAGGQAGAEGDVGAQEQTGTEEQTSGAGPFPWQPQANPWANPWEQHPWWQHCGKGGCWWG